MEHVITSSDNEVIKCFLKINKNGFFQSFRGPQFVP